MHYHKRISRKLALYVLLFSSLITLVMTGIQLLVDYRYGVDVIHQRLDQIANTNIDSFEQALWTLNEKSVDLQLQGLSKINDVVKVELTDLDGQVLKTYSGIEGKPFESRSYPLNYTYRGQGNYLGSVIVYVTKAQLIQHLIDKTLIILGSQAVKTFIVTLFILMTFQYLVTKHLRHISEYARRINLLKELEPLKLRRDSTSSNNGDELDLLVNSINNMQQNLIGVYNKLLKSKGDAARSEARFETIFDSITDAVLFADNDRRMIHLNRAFYKMFQYSEDELVGNTTQMIYASPNEYEKQGKMRFHLGAKSKDKVYKVNYRRKDGSIFPSETLSTHVVTVDGTHIGFLGIIHDISEKIEAQKINKQLQQQLLHAQKMKSIGQLTGGIAHDFNNILGIILGNLDLLKRQIGEDDKAQKRLMTIQKSAERAVNLTRQLLGFSRQQAAQKVVTDINQVVRNMDSLIIRSVTPAVEAEHHLTDDLWLTDIDPGDFEDALLNMVINARDAMPDGGRLILETRNCTLDAAYCEQNLGAKPGDYVQLSISDSGEGISPEQKERIFEPFFTTKPRGEGNGLGLAMVYGFTKRSGGYIEVKSKQKIGTTFFLYLPRSKRLELPVQPVGKQVEVLPQGYGTILVVDDEEDLLELAQTSLEIGGYRVLTATSGKEALQRLAEDSTIDLLFSDIVMPGGINGYELAEEATINRPDLKVLLTSGYTEKVVAHKGQSSFSADLLKKPYTQEELAQRLREKLNE